MSEEEDIENFKRERRIKEEERKAREEEQAQQEKQQMENFKSLIKEGIAEFDNDKIAREIQKEAPEEQPEAMLNEMQRRLPPQVRSGTELMQSIIEPTCDPDNVYDQFHALKDWDLTFTKTDEQRNYLMIAGQLVTALHHNGLNEPASAINAEAKRYAALLRSQDFSQQKELRAIRQYVEGKERTENVGRGGGLFSRRASESNVE